MGAGKIVKNVLDAGVTALQGKPESTESTVEGGETKTSSASKGLVWFVIFLSFGLTLLFVILCALKLLPWKTFTHWIDGLKVWGNLFIPLVIMVGVGRAFKHSVWSSEGKDAPGRRYQEGDLP